MLSASEQEQAVWVSHGEGSLRDQRCLVLVGIFMSKYTQKWSHVSPLSRNNHFSYRINQNHPLFCILACKFGMTLFLSIIYTMSKRTREYDPIPVKSSKRFLKDSEETAPEQPEAKEDLGRLDRFLSDRRMIDHLQKKGIKSLFPIQYMTYKTIFSGRDIKAKDKTGSGKTLAFSLPIVERFRKEKVFRRTKHPKYLIMLPTRELVIQVVGNIEMLMLSEGEFSVLGVYGGEQIRNQIARLERGADIVVATPGRLIDLIGRGVIDLSEILATCLDEADEMLRQSFELDIEKIFAEIYSKEERKIQNLLFSATFPPWVDSISAKYQEKDCQVVDLVSQSAEMPSTIKHYLVEIDDRELVEAVGKLIDHFAKKEGRTIVFCETKRQVGSLCSQFGKGCAELHGDVKQADRERIYRSFKSGQITTVIATNVAARGLDFPDIKLVVQVEPPREVESFVHRSGRTGRAGKSGVNVLLYTRRQRNSLDKIKSTSRVNFESLDLNRLKK